MMSHDDLDRIAREVCAAIGADWGLGTVYGGLREVRDTAHVHRPKGQ